MQRDEQQSEGERHDHQRPKQFWRDGRAAEPEHRSGLMQRVPPIDREFDDRQIDAADQGQDRRRPRRAPRVLDRPPERDQPEIEDEQHQHRGQPGVPHPIGSPHRLAPERAGGQADEGEAGAKRRRGLLRSVGERMAPDQRAKRRQRHHAIDEGRHPGRGDMQIHDPHRLALLIIGRRGEGEPETEREQRRRRRASQGRARCVRPRKTVGLARFHI